MSSACGVAPLKLRDIVFNARAVFIPRAAMQPTTSALTARSCNESVLGSHYRLIDELRACTESELTATQLPCPLRRCWQRSAAKLLADNAATVQRNAKRELAVLKRQHALMAKGA